MKINGGSSNKAVESQNENHKNAKQLMASQKSVSIEDEGKDNQLNNSCEISFNISQGAEMDNGDGDDDDDLELQDDKANDVRQQNGKSRVVQKDATEHF